MARTLGFLPCITKLVASSALVVFLDTLGLVLGSQVVRLLLVLANLHLRHLHITHETDTRTAGKTLDSTALGYSNSHPCISELRAVHIEQKSWLCNNTLVPECCCSSLATDLLASLGLVLVNLSADARLCVAGSVLHVLLGSLEASLGMVLVVLLGALVHCLLVLQRTRRFVSFLKPLCKNRDTHSWS